MQDVLSIHPVGSRPDAGERGVALLVVLVAMVLLTALGLSLSLVTSTENRVALGYGQAAEAFYAAEALLELVAAEVAAAPDWDLVLDGSVTSAFVDGPTGPRTLPDGTYLDLGQETAFANCGRTTCSLADLEASTQERPWGTNNPQWQLFAHGPAASMSTAASVNSPLYVAAWIADDPSENDGNPFRDGVGEPGQNPGLGRLSLLARAYGPAAVRRTLEATIARGTAGPRVLSWREIR